MLKTLPSKRKYHFRVASTVYIERGDTSATCNKHGTINIGYRFKSTCTHFKSFQITYCRSATSFTNTVLNNVVTFRFTWNVIETAHYAIQWMDFKRTTANNVDRDSIHSWKSTRERKIVRENLAVSTVFLITKSVVFTIRSNYVSAFRVSAIR